MDNVGTKTKNVIKLGEWASKVANTVELDLREELKKMIVENPTWSWEQISIQDVFGYAINQLPPIYTVKGNNSNNKIAKSELRNAIKKAMEKIEKNPIHLGVME